MKRYYHIFEEYDVLFSEWHGEARNYACEDIKKFGSAIEFVGLVNESEKALIHHLSDHFPPRY